MFLSTMPDKNKPGSGPSDPPENTVILADTTDRYSYPEHTTPYLFVTTFFNRGRYILNGRAITIAPRQFYFLNSNDTIGIDYTEVHRLRTCLILFKNGFVEDCLAYRFADKQQLLDSPDYRQSKDPRGFASLPFELTETMSRILTQLVQSKDRDILLFDLIVSASEQEQGTLERIQGLPAAKRSTKEELYRRLSVARTFMLDNITQPLSIEQIAAEACLNKYHFLASFKAVYNTSPHRWFTEQKLQKALGLLESGDHTVEDVCYILGFQSPSSFSHLFKRRWQATPSGIQRACRK